MERVPALIERAAAPASETVLLTGATGTVGRELLARLLRTPSTRVLCLVRARDDDEARARIRRTIAELPDPRIGNDERRQTDAMAADLTRDRLGLSQRQWDTTADAVTRIVHGAASVTWNLPLGESRAINVTGTDRVLELAREGRRRGVLRKFDYISTCTVAGRRTGLIGEDDLRSRCGFHNTYEQSKFEAERRVRNHMNEMSVSIFRLAMVVGDSKTGCTSTFNVMYWPLKMMARGYIVAVPGDRAGVLDIVPIDFVGSAIEALSADPAHRGKGFHIAAGPLASSVGEILDLAVDCLGVRPPLLIRPRVFRLLQPLFYAAVWGKRREAMSKGRVYLPYLVYSAHFDTQNARRGLEPAGIHPPAVREYFERLIDYAIASDWGRRRVATVV